MTWTEYWRSTYWPRDGCVKNSGAREVYYPRYFRDLETYRQNFCEQCGVERDWRAALKVSHVHRRGVTNETPGHENCIQYEFKRYTDDPNYPYDPPTLR